MATVSSSNKFELLSACFSCNNNFNRSQSSLGFYGNNIVETPQRMIAGELSIFIRDLSLVLGRPIFIKSKFNSSD